MCGEVRYRFEGEVFGAANCHCVSCRRAAGAAGVQWVFVERGGFAVTRGDGQSPPLNGRTDENDRT